MVAADDDRRLELALPHHLVEGEAEFRAIAEPDPADARGQALELDSFARHVEPMDEVSVVRKDLLHLGVGPINVLRVAGERAPAEGADTAAEERADIGRNEAREIESVGDAHLLGELADVVAV